MPHPTQSEVIDSETGSKKWMPDLSAKGIISYSSEEVQRLFDDGLIDEWLKEFHEQHMNQIHEDYKLFREVGTGEYIRTKNESPETIQEYRSRVKKFQETHEQLTSLRAHIYKDSLMSKATSHLSNSDPDIVWLWTVRELQTMMATKDPSPIHFETVRYHLREKAKVRCGSEIIDTFARRLVEVCNDLTKLKTFSHPIFTKKPLQESDLEEHLKHKTKDLLSLDNEFIKYIERNFGEEGKELAKKIEENSEKLFKAYKESNFNPSHRPLYWGLWIPVKAEDGTISNISNMLKVIARLVWEEELKTLHGRQNKQHPALVKPVIEKFKPLLKPKSKNKVIYEEGAILCKNPDEGIIMTASIDPKLIPIMQNGVNKLASLNGHRMLRWQVKSGFEAWSKGNKDPRKIEINGGFTEIANQIGAGGTPKNIGTIKEILFAQAHGNFKYPDGSEGNMIILNITDKHKNGEPSKITIILGEALLPGYVFKMQRADRMLVPIGDLPPLMGAQNQHAKQAFLQILVFEEFSNQSDRFAKDGYVIITQEKWKEMAVQSGINPNKIKDIVQHWSEPDLVNTFTFLDKQGDEYCLASHYDKESRFLISQGKNRINRSEAGKKSTRRGVKNKKKSKPATQKDN